MSNRNNDLNVSSIERYPLSFGQQRLWFLNQFEQNAATYNMPYANRLLGNLDEICLKQSLGAIIQRHEVLRSRVECKDDGDFMVIGSSLDMGWSIEKAPSAEMEKWVDAQIQSEVARCFDLEKGPLINARLLKLSDEEHILLVTLHHLVSDGWSMGIFWQELSELYRASVFKEMPALKALPIQYSNYAIWQRKRLQGAWLERELKFWAEKLNGELSPLEITADRSRPLVSSHEGKVRRFFISNDLKDRLFEIGRQQSATLYITLLAAFRVLLYRYTNQTDILIGSPVAGRSQPEVQSLIGFFVNTLVMRNPIAGERSFSQILKAEKEGAFEAYAHADVPFEALVEKLAPVRDSVRNPLFQVLFGLQNAEDEAPLSLEGLEVERLNVKWSTSKFDLNLSIIESESVLKADLEYSSDLFSDETIDRMIKHFCTLLESIAEHPEQAVGCLQLAEDAEKRQILRDFNETENEDNRGKTVVDLFQDQVRRTPEKVAVVYEGKKLSYEELNKQANQLAHFLRNKLGVGPEVRVGLFVERSLEMIVGIMAILKAGGAYVPIDSSYPRERMERMVTDSDCRAVLSCGQPDPKLAWMKDKLIEIGKLEAQEKEENPSLDSSVHNAIYVIYTSGSTGQPKASVLEHGAFCNLVSWYARKMDGAIKAVLVVTSACFDLTQKNFFTPLVTGGKIVLAKEGLLDVDAVTRDIAKESVTLLNCTPSLFRLLVQQGGGQLESLQRVVLGGEPVEVAPLREWLEKAKEGTKLVNSYGPTECTDVAVAYEICVKEAVKHRALPLGRPIDNVKIYILDDERNLSPIGCRGEIYIGGKAVGREYLNQPELTSERFVTNPYRAGERMYRTGDLGRWLPDGNLEYMGRSDDQVKIRGYRIELGEVEAMLAKRSEVKAAAVRVWEREDGDKVLCGYVVFEGKWDEQKFRKELSSELPSYMVPTYLEKLESMPLTTSGKINRQALLKPADRRREDEYVAPRTEIETQLCRMWEDALKVKKVGIKDNFFERGGHSIIAMRLVWQLNKAIGTTAELRTLFEHPTIEGFVQEIAIPEKTGEWDSIRRADRSKPLELSYGQQRLWFLNEFDGKSTAYNVPFAFKLKGKVCERSLKKSLEAIIERHEILRSRIEKIDGMASLVIDTDANFAWSFEEVNPEEASKQIRRELETGFDLEKDPLVRSKLLKLSDEDSVWLITLHHIITDGWSMGIFWRELKGLYEANLTNDRMELPPLPIQYVDYSAWQRAWLGNGRLEQELEYWKKKLGEGWTALEMPTDRPRPAVKTYRGAIRSFEFSKCLSSSAKLLSQRQGVTMHVMLLACFRVLLYRYTGQGNILIGSPIAGREKPDLESLIGFFVNTLVMRNDIMSSDTFAEVLGREQENAVEAYGHSNLPFEMLVEALVPERDVSRSPIFQAMFVLQPSGESGLSLKGLEVERLSQGWSTSKFDINLSMEESLDGLKGSFEYSLDLFDETTVDRIIGHFRTLLEKVVDNPKQTVGRLQLMDDVERRQILEEFSGMEGRDEPKETVIELFEKQVRKTPENVAVVCERETLTYKDINKRANQLGHYLKEEFGVGPEVRVGLAAEKSLELIIGILGILKAGGAYVPIDSSYPEERIDGMITDSGCRVVLFHGSYGKKLIEKSAKVLEIGKFKIGTNEENPLENAGVKNAIYVIYTSGSTGRPKASVLEHGAFSNLVSWYVKRLRNALDAVLVVTSPGFDLTQKNFFAPLMVGGKILLMKEGLLDAKAVVRKIAEEKITLLNCTPSLFQLLVQEGEGELASLRGVVLGGEPVDIEPLRPWLARAEAGTKLMNSYGPTECTDVTVAYETCVKEARKHRALPLGKPIDNAIIYVMDKESNLSPIGCHGEICIGGVAVGRGYLNQPELTDQKFIRNPYRPEERIYRTGDLGRWLPDGNLEYLGRIDDQVKVRGYRIELGEVEAVLARQPEVKGAAARVWEGEGGSKILCGYVVSEGDWNEQRLKTSLSKELPGYMVPTYLERLESMPLTTSGKINRRALPKPARRRDEDDYVAPRTKIEARLCRIWEKVLSAERVGIRDNFFQIGGHSLMAIRLTWNLNKELGANVDVRTLFEHPTIEEIAKKIETQEKAIAGDSIKKTSRLGPLNLSYGQQRLWFLNEFDGGSAAYNVPFAFRLKGTICEKSLENSLRAMIERHEILRSRIEKKDGQGLLVIDPEINFGWTIEKVDAGEAEVQIQEELKQDFNLEKGPLIRSKLLRISCDESVWLLTLHHIVTDGWSMGIFWKELSELYGAALVKKPAKLNPLEIQYADYSTWQRAWLSAGRKEQEIEYWKNKLSEGWAVLEMPTDHIRPAVKTYHGGIRHFQFSKHLTEKLVLMSQRYEATMHMTLLACFRVLLYRYTRQEDILIGSPTAGRERPELESLIGFFVNTLVMRNRLTAFDTFEEVLGRERRSAMEAYRHSNLPFEMLVEALVLERDLSRSPLFQAMFVLQPANETGLVLPGLRIERLEQKWITSKFDLNLSMQQSSDGLMGSFEYSSDLFDEETIDRMIGHFEKLIENIVTNPKGEIGGFEILKKSERRQILEDFNDTTGDFPGQRTIVELFEERVKKSAHDTALICGRESLSFEELNKRANKLARHLKNKFGIKSEASIALVGDRSLEMIVGILGILKAGGAYVPIDPNNPSERIEFLLEDSQAEVVVAGREHREKIPPNYRVLELNQDLHQEDDENLNVVISPDCLAYVIYTSGSTGRPKGVMVEHRSILRLVKEVNYVPLNRKTRMMQLAPLSFDAATFEIWGALLNGGVLVVYPGDLLFSNIGNVIAEHGVNTLWLTSSLFNAVIDDAPETLRHIKYLLTGGEVVSLSHVRRGYELYPEIKLFNGYGPTECTTFTTTFPVSSRELDRFTSLPIGKPISNTKVYILDVQQNQLLPVGVAGEIGVSGPGLARGYLNQPELTASKFFENPFEKGQRIYRTGDLGRWMPDGNVEYMGRIDDQVKIRGHRIELGEIEATLQRQPGVKTAVAVVYEERGEKLLCGYIVHDDSTTLTALNHALARELPNYMVPDLMRRLETMPITKNGKIDRKKLERIRPLTESEKYVAARTPDESKLCEIWQDILATNQISVHDDFFKIGGHSLGAIKVIARVNAAFGIALSVRMLFEFSTLEDFAALVATTQKSARLHGLHAESTGREEGEI